MDPSLPVRSAYLRPATVAAWTLDDLAGWAGEARAHGVTAAITKLDLLTPDRTEILAAQGLVSIGAFACYSDHARSVPLSGARRPVAANGRPWETIEWYEGVVPGEPRHDEALERQLALELRQSEAQIVLLDFLRWPGHWEIESRGGRHPRPSSFDERTLARFASHIGRPTAGVATVEGHRAEWEQFRVDTITSSAERLASVIRAAGATPGAFLVPVDHPTRRADYGQDVVELARHVSLFALMSYQQMMRLTDEDVLAMAAEIASRTAAPVVAMVQTTADAAFAGPWDWGPPAAESALLAHIAALESAVRDGRLAGTSYFPGEAPLPDIRTADSSAPEGTIR